jgi:ribosomal protein S18 acetylase RimI-like enzyme
MAEARITLRRVEGDRTVFMPLLLEADESEAVVRTYLDDGDLFELLGEEALIGVVLLTTADPSTVEIKNIALEESHRGRGWGRAAIQAVTAHTRAGGATRLRVGTADSSVGTIAFYKACGFHDAGRIAGFFDAYPEPVIEDGVQAHDMVMFEMEL